MRFGLLICLSVILLSLQQATGVLWGTFERTPGAHNVRGRVRLLNAKTIQLENFSFDGRGFEVFAYYYRPGDPVLSSGGGSIIPVPGSNNADGRFNLGRSYNDDVLLLPLPDGVDACDISTLTIWCRPATAIFNRVTLTRSVFMSDDEVGGASTCALKPENIEVPLVTPLNNCMFLDPSLRLKWRVDREQSNVMFQLCGCLSSNPDVNQYMGFGVSGSDSSTLMVGGDPTITWVDSSSQPNARDYHLSAYTQCVTDQGACPDTVRGCTDDATLVSGFRDDTQQCVTFTRPFTPTDVGVCDRPLDPDNTQLYIVWGVGGLGSTAFRHFLRAQATDSPLHLGRTPLDSCGTTPISCTTCSPYVGQRIIARDNTTFRAVIGPSGNNRGYTSIAGLPSWGIAWYLNGILIPELVVQRGSTYTFIVEGGENPSVESAYHPLYITSSMTGSRISDSNIRNTEVVYAGFTGDQETAVGRLCELVETPSALASRTSCQDLDDYLSKLEDGSGCSQGQAGTLSWTPDENTPDTVYYQCATHKNLGWRIRVINEGDPIPAGATPTHTVTALSILLCVLLALFLAGAK
ncbi:protein Skeletor, isoforms B/C-like isoform X4 [Halichondria panicea]|uniref:protein Skeletor, isoforms B/C-like isoform X4 n=1 Tax=Halichondria panicea TaxID=6063 RepID=UPI00312B72C7